MTVLEHIEELAQAFHVDRYTAPTWVSLPWKDYELFCDGISAARLIPPYRPNNEDPWHPSIAAVIVSVGRVRLYPGLPWGCGDDENDPAHAITQPPLVFGSTLWLEHIQKMNRDVSEWWERRPAFMRELETPPLSAGGWK